MITIETPVLSTLSMVASGGRALVLRIDGDEHFAAASWTSE